MASPCACFGCLFTELTEVCERELDLLDESESALRRTRYIEMLAKFISNLSGQPIMIIGMGDDSNGQVVN
jgi:hypothetical protein